MQLFPARIRTDGTGVRATFRDIPEAQVWAESREKVIELAQEALLAAIDGCVEVRRLVPPPSKPRSGEVLIKLPASAVAKVLLLNEMTVNKVDTRELARRLGITTQAAHRMVDLRHATSLDLIDDALGAVGKRLALIAV